MSRYGYFDTFCRDSGSRWSTLPGKHCASVRALALLNALGTLLTCRSMLCMLLCHSRYTVVGDSRY